MSYPNSDGAPYTPNEPSHQPSAQEQWANGSPSQRPEFGQEHPGSQELWGSQNPSGNQQWHASSSPRGDDHESSRQGWNSSPSWQDSAPQNQRYQNQQSQNQQPQNQQQGQYWDQRQDQQPYASYPNQYGGQYGGQNGGGPRRPALVTTGAVLGFIFSPFGFISGAIGLFSMALFSRSLSFTNSNVLLGWIWTLCTLVSGLLLFIGSVQAISGRSPHLSGSACVIFLLGQLVVPLSAHIETASRDGRSPADTATAISWGWTYFVVCALLAALQLCLLYLPDARRWFAAKKPEFAR